MKKTYEPKATKILSYAAFLCFVLSISFTSTVVAQESTNASGGTVKNSNGEVSYSIGQIAYEAQSSIAGSINQGVQVAYIVTETTHIDNYECLSHDISVFPNPSTDYLNLKIENFENRAVSELYYQLFDLNGKLILNGMIKSSETKIDMQYQKTGTYLVKVLSNNKEVKTYKILKK